jgi:hypothetical protein
MAAALPLLLLLLLLALPAATHALTADGQALLAFKAAVLRDPTGALADWNASAADPCSWNGVACDAAAAGIRRVEFRVDARNARSQAAMAKLGATREGLLRADRITWNGHVRDTVLFSILKDEWPN